MRGSVGAFVIGALFLLVGLGGVVAAWGAYLTDTAIEREGPRAQGRLEKKLFLSAADGDSDFVVEYWFKTKDGTVLNASRSISKELWTTLREGQALQIRYSTSNPRRNFPAGAGVTSVGVTVFVSVVAAAIAMLGGLLVWGYYRGPQTKT